MSQHPVYSYQQQPQWYIAPPPMPSSSPTNRSGASNSNFSYQSYENVETVGGSSSNSSQNNRLAKTGSYAVRYSPSYLAAAAAVQSSNNSNSMINRIVNDMLSWQQQQPLKKSASSAVAKRIVPIEFESSMEQAILASSEPLEMTSNGEEEIIEVNGERGVWANKREIEAWRATSDVPLSAYQLNQDPNPQLVKKQTTQRVEYVQELAIRYLRPPTPPPPGEIIIQQMADVVTPPAPPLVIRQQPPRPITPEPIVIREAPPPPPCPISRKVITISGKKIPPPPRKVIIERLAPIPPKPQSVIIERWLPYTQVKRKVIFNRAREQSQDPILVKPRNVIVQWTAPQVQIKREFRYLGVIRANPGDYVSRYGNALKLSRELPTIVTEIPTPAGFTLAADEAARKRSNVPELEGDLDALRLVDLDREGLSEYRPFLSKLGIFATTDFPSNQQTVTTLNSGQQMSTLYSVPIQTESYVPAPLSNAMFGGDAPITNANNNTSSTLVKNNSYYQSSTSYEFQPSFKPQKTPVPFRNRIEPAFTTMSPVASINTTLVTTAYSPASFATGTTVIRGPQGASNGGGGEKASENVMVVSTPATFTQDATKSPFNTTLALETSIAATSPTFLGDTTNDNDTTTEPPPPPRQQKQPAYKLTIMSSSASSSSTSTSSSSTSSSSSSNQAAGLRTKTPDEFIQKIFESIDIDNNGRISVPEAQRILLRMNTRLNRRYGQDDVNALFHALDIDRDGTIDFDEFKAGFRNLGV